MIKFLLFLFLVGCTTSDRVCKTVCVPDEECSQKCKTHREWLELDGY